MGTTQQYLVNATATVIATSLGVIATLLGTSLALISVVTKTADKQLGERFDSFFGVQIKACLRSCCGGDLSLIVASRPSPMSASDDRLDACSQDESEGPPKASGDDLASLSREAQSLLSNNHNNGNDADDEDAGGGPTVSIQNTMSSAAGRSEHCKQS